MFNPEGKVEQLTSVSAGVGPSKSLAVNCSVSSYNTKENRIIRKIHITANKKHKAKTVEFNKSIVTATAHSPSTAPIRTARGAAMASPKELGAAKH
jgi:hypothetical protein